VDFQENDQSNELLTLSATAEMRKQTAKRETIWHTLC